MMGSPYPNIRAARAPCGVPRPYAQALADNVIDPRIRELVGALNVEGVCSTFASCEGHGFIRCLKQPYVALTSSTPFAGALSMALEQDAARDEPHLHYYWTVSGIFDLEGQLRFCLAPGQYVRGWWATERQRIDEDFTTLSRLAKVLAERWKTDPPKMDGQRKDQHEKGRRQHAHELKSTVGANETERVDRAAARAGFRSAADGCHALFAWSKRHMAVLLDVVSVRA